MTARRSLSLALVGALGIVGGGLAAAPARADSPSYTITSDSGYSVVDATTDTGVHCSYSNCGTTITTPFPLKAYGGNYSQAYVSSNGTMQFGPNVTDQSGPGALPNGAFAGPTFLPLWGYYHYTGTQNQTSYGIFTRTLGVAPNRQYIVEWKLYDGNLGYYYTFEQTFAENSGVVATTYGTTGSDGGSYATVGAQNGSTYSQYENEQQGALYQGLRVTYTPNGPSGNAPSAPTNPSDVIQNPNSTTLFWDPPTSTGGSPITGYQVHRDGVDTNGHGAYTSGILAADTTSAPFNKLVPGNTYHLSVVAINANGTSQPASVSVTQPSSTPTAPVIGQASPGTAGAPIQAVARWSAPNSTNGAAITHYRVYAYRVSNGRIVQTVNSNLLPAGARNFSMQLPVKGQWQFRVVAYNSKGASPYSGYSNVVTAR